MARKRSASASWVRLGKSAARALQRAQRSVGRQLARTLADAAKVGSQAAKPATRSRKRAPSSLGKDASASPLTDAALAQRDAMRRALSGVATPVNAPAARAGGRWLEGSWGTGALSQRSYRLFIPAEAGQSRPCPLLVLLHGCAQDAGSFAACTRAAALARTRQCMVLLPEQSSQANPHRCWNWFRGEAVAAAEAALLMAIVDHVRAVHAVRAGQIYLLGLSAGGAMALTMALRYPERFAAVGSHSGAVPHVASSAAQAARVMRGSLGDPGPLRRQGLRLRLAGRRPPPLLLIHGDADRVVALDNAAASVQLWLSLLPEAQASDGPVPSPSRRLQRGARRAITLSDWLWQGRPYIRWITVEGLGHAWSGGPASQAYADPHGPDALRLAFAFFDAAAPASARQPDAAAWPGVARR